MAVGRAAALGKHSEVLAGGVSCHVGQALGLDPQQVEVVAAGGECLGARSEGRGWMCGRSAQAARVHTARKQRGAGPNVQVKSKFGGRWHAPVQRNEQGAGVVRVGD